MLSLNIYNRTDKNIDAEYFKLIFKKIFSTLKEEKEIKEKLEKLSDINLIFVTGLEMKKINNDFRGVDKVTDVLSFGLEGDKNFVVRKNNDNLAGEIFISFSEAKRQAALLNISTKKEIVILLIHGILHVLGYDHEKEKEKVEMRKMENKILKNAYAS